jgi:FkbM family methyltransferase
MGGFYVEIGANDGRSFSNTYVLEKTRNWSGILVEPILHKHFESKVYRDPNRNKFIYGACVSSDYKEQSVKMYFSNLMTSSDLGNSREWAQAGSIFLQDTEEVLPFWSPAVVLSDILESEGITKVDFLSIDVEGAELNVLKGLDFEKCEITSILLETKEDSECINYLEHRGYLVVEKLGVNYFLKKAPVSNQVDFLSSSL